MSIIRNFDDWDNDYREDADGNATDVQKIIEITIERAHEALEMDYLPLLRQHCPDLHVVTKDFKHMNLYKHGWRFQYGKSRQWAGLCDPTRNQHGKSKGNKNLYLSIDFVRHDNNWSKNADSTIHHEMAHAIVDELFIFSGHGMTLAMLDPSHRANEGHGAIWQMVCKAIAAHDGVACTQYYTNSNFKPSFRKYKYECLYCDHVDYGDSRTFATRCKNCMKPVTVETNN